jgi:hypothetical protein
MFFKHCVAGAPIVCAVMGLALVATAQTVPSNPMPDAMLRSTPQTVVWGYITADLLQERFGLTPADAYALPSIAVDFRVAEAVDSTQVIYGMIPKKLFKTNPPYWAAR